GGTLGQEAVAGVDRLDKADDATAERKRLVDEYEAEFANPYIAAARGYVDEVIKPSETRPRVIRALEVLENKRDVNPRKKHGNIPL
ncbi:MAG: carboxyl transferase domain-containing protein, partial [Chloroflexota bacterium]